MRWLNDTLPMKTHAHRVPTLWHGLVHLLRAAWFLAAFHSAGPASAADNLAVSTDFAVKTHYPKWMRWVPDSVPISLLSIPSSHDSMARIGGPLAITQSLALADQLEAGIRALDIRARHVGDRFNIYHGIVDQGFTFEDVLNSCNAFLALNPTETIFIDLSANGVPAAKDCTREFHETFKWYRDESGLGGRILNLPYSRSRDFDMPLGEVRGKIVIIVNFACITCGLIGGDIDGNDYSDMNTYFDIDKKWKSIVDHAFIIDAGDAGTMYGNSSTGYSDNGGLFPIDVATGILGYEGIPSRLQKFLFNGNQKRTVGMFWMDFPGPALIGTIIAHNLKFTTNLTAVAGDFAKIVADAAYTTSHSGADAAADHTAQLQNFLDHIVPGQNWNVLASTAIDALNWGYAIESDGLEVRTGDVDGYTMLAFNSRRVEPPVSRQALQSFLTIDKLLPLSGDANTRARAARSLLQAHFPKARWQVAVRRMPFDAANWSARVDSPAITSVTVPDAGGIFLYTAWATSAPNRAPVPDVNFPKGVDEGALVRLDASPSHDDDGDGLLYRWDLDADGTWDTDREPSPYHFAVFHQSGTRSLMLEVFDGSLATTQKVALNVRNVAPTADLGTPRILGPDRRWTDVLEITEPGNDAFSATISWGDGSPVTVIERAPARLPVDHLFPDNGNFVVTVDLRDDEGATSRQTVRIVTGFPALSAARAANGALRLSWSLHPAPFRLETTTGTDGSPWLQVTQPPDQSEGRWVLGAPASDAGRFFRLIPAP